MNLTKYEQETIINFNTGEKNATVFTMDSTVIRQLDTLVHVMNKGSKQDNE